MASLPLTLAPATTGGPAAALEGGAPAKGGADGTGGDNHAAGLSFPLLMKKAAPAKDKKPTAEDALLAMTAAPLPSPPDSTALPAAGTVLPPALPQNVDTTPVQAGAAAPAQAQPEGRKGAATMMAALAGGTAAANADGDAAVEASASAPGDGDDGKASADRFAADMAARFVLPAQVMTYGSPDGHQVAQGLLKEMNAALIGDHSGDGVKALSSADGVASNQGAGALLQSGDKLPAAAPTNTVISVPLSHPDWSDELGNRVNWMIHQEVQTASVKLNPPHLGPLEVKVSLVNDQVNVSFTTHHALVRDTLDASMPRLRDMLGNSGLQLGDANVTHHSFSGQQQSGQQSSGYGGGAAEYGGAASDVLLSAGNQPLYYVGDGAVDLYA